MMIRYKHPVTGADIVTSNDGRPQQSRNDRKIDRVTTADIERLPDGSFRRKKEGTDEKPQ